MRDVDSGDSKGFAFVNFASFAMNGQCTDSRLQQVVVQHVCN